MSALKGYAPRDNRYLEAKNKLLNNVENFYKGRGKVIEGFKNGAFSLYYNETYEYQMKAEREIEKEEREKKEDRERKKKSKKKNKKKNQRKTNFSNILRMNQKILTIFGLIILKILQNLVIWQKNYLK